MDHNELGMFVGTTGPMSLKGDRTSNNEYNCLRMKWNEMTMKSKQDTLKKHEKHNNLTENSVQHISEAIWVKIFSWDEKRKKYWIKKRKKRKLVKQRKLTNKLRGNSDK